MPHTSPPRVTAVVVTFNPDTDRLDRCLRSLAASNDVDVQIVLVDNASRQEVVHPGATRVLRRDHNGGFAAGVNDGIRAASTPYIAVVNDDAYVAPEALRRCIDALAAAAPRALAAAPKVLFADLDKRDRPDPYLDSVGVVLRPNGEAFSAGAGQPDIGQFDTDAFVLGPCLSAAVFRREAFTTVGLFDERYFLYYEDVDWALRCFLSGHDTVFVATAIVHHHHAASTRALGEQRRFRLVQRNLLLCATANLAAGTVARVWWGRLIVAVKALLRGPDRLSRLLALVAAAWRAPSVLPVRRRRRRVATRPDHEAFAYAAGLEPFVDVTTYRPDRPDQARRAAHDRVGRQAEQTAPGTVSR